MVSRELQAQAGLLQAQPGDLGLADRLVLVAYRLTDFFVKIVNSDRVRFGHSVHGTITTARGAVGSRGA